MFPQLRLTPARTAFARPGPRATAFPDVTAPMQPSDSLAPFGRRSGHPSPAAYLGAEVLFFTAAPVPPANRCNAGDISTPAPRKPALYPRKNEGIPGAWAILFVRAVVYDPAGCDHPSPVLGEVAVAFRRVNTLGTRKHVSFVATYPRPTRSRAYASPNPLPSPAQGSLPAGRAHPSPGGFRTRWMTNKVSWGHRILHSPLDQPCLVALPPKLIIFNGFLVGAGAQHCQGQIRQRDRFATTMTIPTRNGDFGVTRAGSEWPARRAHSTACPNA